MPNSYLEHLSYPTGTTPTDYLCTITVAVLYGTLFDFAQGRLLDMVDLPLLARTFYQSRKIDDYDVSVQG